MHTEFLSFFEENSDPKAGLSFVVRINSTQPNSGPHVLISCGVHGNESVGPQFAQWFIDAVRRDTLTLTRGRVTFLLSNPRAVARNTRFCDTDMNRVFRFQPKHEHTYEYTRAQEIDHFIAREQFDYAIDLHSVSIGEFQMMICDKTNTTLRALLERTTTVPTLFYYDKEHIPGTLHERMSNYGCEAVIIECGNHTSPYASVTARKQVLIMLSEWGLIDTTQTQRDAIIPHNRITRVETIGIVRAGDNHRWLVDNPKTGVRLYKGQPICTDSTNGTQISPQNCILYMPMLNVTSADSDAGFLCVEV